METAKQRQTRITILSILYTIFGAFELLGLAMAYVSNVIEPIQYISLVTSLLQFAAAYGLWGMKRWGAIVGVVEEALSIVYNTASIPLVGAVAGITIGINIMFLTVIISAWKNFS
jgi:uncharacterized membrane protein (DUF2068 family)